MDKHKSIRSFLFLAVFMLGMALLHVRAMNHCKVLSNEILEECLYDSYEDTRRFAKRLAKRNGR